MLKRSLMALSIASLPQLMLSITNHSDRWEEGHLGGCLGALARAAAERM